MLLCCITQQRGTCSLTPGGEGLPPEPLSLYAQPSELIGFISLQKGDSLHHIVEAGHGEHKELCGRKGEG